MKKVLLILLFTIIPVLMWFAQKRLHESLELMSEDMNFPNGSYAKNLNTQ